MQWSKAVRGNPWPKDMLIRITHDPHHLTLLLYIRHAWSIAGDVELPELDPVPDAGHSSLPVSAGPAEWERRWKEAWSQAWKWFEVEDPSRHPTSAAEMRELTDPALGLNPVVPPFWTQQYEWEGLDRVAYQAWDQGLVPKFPNDAERQSLPALIAAWESGLDSIIVLPYRGYFAQRITRRHLVVSAEVRSSPEQYSRALSEGISA
jgi:hypothetical protein